MITSANGSYPPITDTQLERVTAQVAYAEARAGDVFREMASGAKPDRAQLRRLLDQLDAGDVPMMTRLDRLARSTFDPFAIVKQIVDAKAQFRSLAEPWADTGTSTGRLMLAVLGGLADVERDLIRTRTAEGRSRAKAQGWHVGQQSSGRGHQTARAGCATLQELADSFDRSIATMRRAMRAA